MMTLEHAISKATLFYDMIGMKVKNTKKNKIKVVSRVTAYKKDVDSWDVAIFFKTKYRIETGKPDCYLWKFLRDYEVISKN